MQKKELSPTVADGWVYGILPEGCQLCIHGMKMVYFMGGDCSRPKHCNWYCPISEKRKSTTAFYIDEIPILELNSLP